MHFRQDPVATVWIKLVVALPNLKPLVHYPDAVVLEIGLNTVSKVNDALLPLETQVDLVLQRQRVD